MSSDRKDQGETRHKAVALRYDAAQDSAPQVIAKGSGLVAERILEIARQEGIHVHNDPDLVNVLSKLDIETAIPEDLFVAVAEVLAFVYRLNDRLGPPAR